MRATPTIALFLFAAAIAAATSQAAAETAAPHQAPPGASSCSGCHAPAGAGAVIPSLDGATAAKIVADMRAFRTGAREATVMGRIAKGFTEEETRVIAEWLAAGGRKNAGAPHAEP